MLAAHLMKGSNIASGRRLDESSEAEGDNENSIPQESSIAANVSIQNQRRATGTLNAQNSQSRSNGLGGGSGLSRGKSTPVLKTAVAGNAVDGIKGSNGAIVVGGG